MSFVLSPERRAELEAFLQAHPLPEDDDPELFDDRRTREADDLALARLAKRLLEMDKHTV